MSRWWDDRWVAVLSPEGVALARCPRDRHAACELHVHRACESRTPEAALEALRSVLAQEGIGRGKVTLLLSNHFVQYLLVPWRAGLTRPRELATFAELCFEETFGADAGARTVLVGRERAGSARVAAALDRSWLDALKSAVAGSPLRLVSIQPYLCALFDRAQKRLHARDFLLLVAEPTRSCVLVASGGQWRSLRSMATPAHARDLADLVEREVQLCGLAEDAMPLIFVHAPGQHDLEVPTCNGVLPRRLELPAARQPVEDPLLAMAETVA